VLIGRARELEKLGQALEHVLTGSGALALVLGEAGIGKSCLLAELGRMAHAQGYAVCTGRCFSEASLRALAPWREALGDIALGDARQASAPLDAADARMRTFEAVLAELGTRTRLGPLLIVIEDLHWGDRDSLDLLLHCLRFGMAGPLLVVASLRSNDLDAARNTRLETLLAELAREPRVERLDLRAFSIDEVSQYAEQVAGGAVPQAVAQAIWRETAGNALYVRELTRHLAEEGKIVLRAGRIATDFAAAELAPPPSVRDVVRQRVARLSPNGVALLRVASALGTVGELSTLAAAADIAPELALDAIDESIAAGVLRVAGSGYEISHAIVRRAIYEEQNPDRRARCHRRLAEALHATRQPDHAEIARQYHASRSLPGAEAGVAHAELAAAAAVNTASYVEEVAFLGLALELSMPLEAAARCDIACRLAVAQARALDAPAAVASAEAAARELERLEASERVPTLFAHVARELAAAGVARSVWDPLVEQGLRAVGEQRDLAWARLRLLAQHPVPLLRGPVFVSRFEPFEPLAVQIIREQGGELDYASSVDIHDRRSPDETTALIARARRFREPAAAIRVLDACGRDLFFRGEDLAAASAHMHELLSLAERTGSLLGQVSALAVLGCNQAVMGELAAARSTVERCQALSSHIGAMHRMNVVGPHAVAAVVGYIAGTDWSRVQQPLLDFASSPRAASTPFGLVALNLGLLAAGMAGDIDTAQRLLPVHIALLEPLGTSWNEWGAARDCGVSVLWTLGEQRHAARYQALAERGLTTPGCACWSSAAHSLARVRALLGDIEAATRWFAVARKDFAKTGRPACLAICDFDEALALIRHGTPDAARTDTLLNAAERSFEALGMATWLHAARQQRMQPVRVAPPAGLSERELEVLRWLAQGLSNKEIATKLFVSVPTIERHVVNVYAKIGSRGRAAATAYALKKGLLPS
jgi:DNA-binding CsgD family transcriptional regulator